MAIAVVGLYLLCMKDGFGSIQSSDWLLLLCAVLFSFQIMAVDHFSLDGRRAPEPLWSFFVSVESTVAAFCSSSLPWQSLSPSPGPSCTAASCPAAWLYTLQILGQRDFLNPPGGGLFYVVESVFSALGGWLLLHQNLSFRNLPAACCCLPPWCWHSCPLAA